MRALRPFASVTAKGVGLGTCLAGLDRAGWACAEKKNRGLDQVAGWLAGRRVGSAARRRSTAVEGIRTRQPVPDAVDEQE